MTLAPIRFETSQIGHYADWFGNSSVVFMLWWQLSKESIALHFKPPILVVFVGDGFFCGAQVDVLDRAVFRSALLMSICFP